MRPIDADKLQSEILKLTNITDTLTAIGLILDLINSAETLDTPPTFIPTSHQGENFK